MTGITENQQRLSQSTAGNKCKMIIKKIQINTIAISTYYDQQVGGV